VVAELNNISARQGIEGSFHARNEIGSHIDIVFDYYAERQA